MGRIKIDINEFNNQHKKIVNDFSDIISDISEIQKLLLSINDNDCWKGNQANIFYDDVKKVFSINGGRNSVSHVLEDKKQKTDSFLTQAAASVTALELSIQKEVEESMKVNGGGSGVTTTHKASASTTPTQTKTASETTTKAKETPTKTSTVQTTETTTKKAQTTKTSTETTTKKVETTKSNDETTTKKAETTQASSTTYSKTSLPNLKSGTNVIDTSAPCYKGKGYQLSDYEIRRLAYLAKKEQGSVEGAKIELSQMANLTEYHGKSDVYDYVFSGGKSFYGPVRRGQVPEYPEVSQEYIDAVKEVLVEGNRYLPPNVVEHDWIGDISKVTNEDGSFNKYNRNQYVPGQTKIYASSHSLYVFVGFAPNGGDPYGYKIGEW